MAQGVRRLRLLWRQLLRLERPRQALVRWRTRGVVAVVLCSLVVAVLSSWPWLVEPSLRPGLPAPFTLRAPRDSRVVDSAALERRRSQMGPRTQVQVVDERANQVLQAELDRRLAQVRQQTGQDPQLVDPLNLTGEERRWLATLTPADLVAWERGVRQAQLRMLSQGVVASVADQPLLNAAILQLEDQPLPARSLGSRLIAEGLQGRSNLRNDAFLTQRRIENLVTMQGLPTLTVRKGDLITRQGEPISPQAFDVLDYFGLVNRRPLVRAWLAHFAEAFAVTAVMVLVIRRWRASLEPRQALLAMGMLVLVQALKLWLGSAINPLAVLVPPTLLVAQGLGTASGLAWLAAASLLWPVPYEGLSESRLLIAAAVSALAAVLAGRQRSRAQLLQLAVLLPGGALVLQWLLLQSTVLTGRTVGVPTSVSQLLGEAVLVGGLLMAGLLVAPWWRASSGC